MRYARRLRRSAIVWLFAVLGVGALIGAGSILMARGDDPGQATITSLSAASQVLRGPVPQVRELPAGWKLRAVGVDPIESTSRSVHLSYGKDTRSLVLLTITRATITPLEADEHMIFGTDDVAVISRDLSDGTRDVGYAWNAGPYGLTLHVNLSSGVTRDLADRMARSVR